MSTPDPARKLTLLLKKLRGGDIPARDESCDGCPEGADPLLWQFVYSFLIWESSPAKAGAAAKRLQGAVVDYNEMRVALTDELASMIGERYPRAAERAARLRSALNDLYKREHAVTLKRIAELSKRDARVFLESLEGTPPFVAARMVLLALGGHAFPLDERLHRALAEEDAVPRDLSLTDASGWMERQFRAGEATEPYLVLERWMNDRPAPRAPKRPERRIVEAPLKDKPDQAAPGRKAAVAERPKRPRKSAKE